MRKQKRGLIAIALILLLLVAAFFGLRAYNRAAEERADAEEVRYDLTDLDESAVLSLTIENANGALTFTREGESWTGTDGAEALSAVDADKVADILYDACHLSGDYRFEDAADLSEYGLDDPAVTVTLGFLDGAQTILRFGDENTSVSRCYAAVSGDGAVYLVTSYTRNQFNKTADDFLPAETEGESQ